MRTTVFFILIFSLSSLMSCISKSSKSSTEVATDTLRTVEATVLLDNLRSVSAKGYMFGHHDDTLYGVDWDAEEGRSDVKSVCGDYPAVVSFDLGRIELGGGETLDKVAIDNIRKEAIAQYKRGGLVSFSWHLDNPLTGGDSWDVSDSTVVASVLEGGSRHELYVGWLDSIADFMNSITDENGDKIPILFRPYHENTGSWFWWGKALCSPQEYKALWKMTWEHMHQKGANQLLYGYSPSLEGMADFEERYPGDEYVDLIGFDSYDHTKGANNAAEFAENLDKGLAALTAVGAKHDKPIALTEVGAEGIPVNTWWTDVLHKTVVKYPLAYVLVWRNAREIPGHYYAPYPGHNSAENFVNFYEDPKTLFSKDINLYK